MSNFSEQLELIETLISSTAKPDKSCAYPMLLQLQEQSTRDDVLSQLLVESSQTLMSLIVKDAEDKDEEISVLALKCLGFMIYFPPIVSKIPGDTAGAVLEKLAGVIMTTKMKTICNLAVWCLSIQNLEPSILVDHSGSLVRAVVHSLDNPIGSLSTTFEGTQAVMKLATQVKKVMKDTSSIWVPPIFRRLVSVDKKERDMCQRCLLKVESIIYPPSLPLSKAIFKDIKTKLLPGVSKLLKHGKKVQALQAWRWFILFLGPQAVKNRHLVNDMLKVPEQTFSDQDPQVQVASLVSWEGLIDVLIGVSAARSVEDQKNLGDAGLMKRNVDEVKTDRYLKSLKLIMTPLIGIMSNQCDTSVRSSCFSTWCYLLNKLDICVNDSGVISVAVEPMFKAVFQIGLEEDSFYLWECCIHLLDNFIQSKCSNARYGANDHIDSIASALKSHDRTLLSDKCSWKQYSINWLPWDCSQLGFFLRTVNCIISQAFGNMTTVNIRNLYSDWVLRILRSLFKGVQLELGRLSTGYDDLMQSLKTILKFVNCICEAVVSKDVVNVDLLATSLQLIKVIVEELDPTFLGSPLYKIDLDFKYISNLKSVGEANIMLLLGVDYADRLDMAPPILYLTTMYFSLLIHTMLKTGSIEFMQQEVRKYLRVLLSSYNPVEIFRTIVGLFDYCDSSCLKLWIAVAQGLEGFLDSATNLMLLNTHSSNGSSFTICHLFLCPLVMSFSQKLSTVSTTTNCSSPEPCDAHPSSQRHTFEEVKRTWKSLYCSIIACTHQDIPMINTFAEDLSLLLSRFLDSTFSISKCAIELTSVDIRELNLLSLCGEVVICMLDNVQIRKLTPEKHDSDCNMTSSMDNCFEFIARVLKLSALFKKSQPLAISDVIPRIISSLTQCVCRLELRNDIHGFSKVICDALLPWMSIPELNPESLAQKLQLLWSEILASLQRSKPAIIFDSSCLQLQADILKVVLVHPIPSIRDPTISFWNSTYGDQTSLDFPPCLTTVLDKLSREGKIKINKRRPSNGSEKDDACVSCKYKVTATRNMNSKRVELLKETEIDHGCTDKPRSTVKRHRRELTEHQKEVRRAQQGRARDCGGHGPGIRTYTGLDFSQGNAYEDSEDQESQEIRNPELILDLLKRTD